jgi:hypothetical protein
MVSRVVPGTGETIMRSSPNKRFVNDDLPTLGRPTMDTRISSSWGSAPTALAPPVRSSTISNNVLMRRPWDADTVTIPEKPNRAKSPKAASWRSESALFTDQDHPLPQRGAEGGRILRPQGSRLRGRRPTTPRFRRCPPTVSPGREPTPTHRRRARTPRYR